MRKRNVVVAACAAVAIAGLTASIAVATIPDTRDGQIHGCRSIKTGTLRVVDAEAGQTCSKTEQAVNWSGDTRRAYLVRRSAYNSAVELSATPTTLMSVTVPTIGEGAYQLTARIPVISAAAGATVTCEASGATGGRNFGGTFVDSDSLTIGSGDDNVLELQTIAMTTRDYDTDEWTATTVTCAATAPDGENVRIGEYQIALIPIPTPVVTE